VEHPPIPPQRRRTQHSDMLGWVYVGVGIWRGVTAESEHPTASGTPDFIGEIGVQHSAGDE